MGGSIAAAARRTNRVPAQFTGLARDLRRRIAVDEAGLATAMDAAEAPARARLAGGSALRPADLSGLAQRWRSGIPTAGRLALDVALDQRRHVLRILETRATPGELRLVAWTDDEAERCLVLVEVETLATRTNLVRHVHQGAMISLHAMARRYQRAVNNSDHAVRADLLALATARTAILGTGGSFALNVPEGRWVGRLLVLDSKPILCRGRRDVFDHARRDQLVGVAGRQRDMVPWMERREAGAGVELHALGRGDDRFSHCGYPLLRFASYGALAARARQ
jgi:hypothetical protein